MTEDQRTNLLYIAAVIIIILAIIAFLAWHTLASGTFPLGLCSECHG